MAYLKSLTVENVNSTFPFVDCGVGHYSYQFVRGDHRDAIDSLRYNRLCKESELGLCVDFYTFLHNLINAIDITFRYYIQQIAVSLCFIFDNV